MRQFFLIALRAGDQVATFLGKEVRPLLQSVLIDDIDVMRDQVLNPQPDSLVHDVGLSPCVHRQSPISSRYFFQNPRTDASVARNGCERALEPPIIKTPASSS